MCDTDRPPDTLRATELGILRHELQLADEFARAARPLAAEIRAIVLSSHEEPSGEDREFLDTFDRFWNARNSS